MVRSTPHETAVPAPSARGPDDTDTLWPDEPIAHDAANRAGGRDLVIGDLHGHFDTLEHALAALAFDTARDRLFSVGDLIDRGPRSRDAIEWLTAGRFAGAVRGNHELMMVDALRKNADGVAAVSAGVPLPTVVAVLGHASPNTTAVYTTATVPKPASSSHACGAELP